MKLKTMCMAALLTLGASGMAYATPVNFVQNGDFSNITPGSKTAPGTVLSVINREHGQQRPQWVTVDHWTVNGAVNDGKTAQGVWYQNADAAMNGPGGPQLGGTIPAPPGDGAFVGLNGDPNMRTTISQQLSLAKGGYYVVSFDWAEAQQGGVQGPTTEQFQVSLGGKDATTQLFSIDTHGFEGWQHQSFGFVADSDSPWLTFLSIGTPSGAPPMALLTNVSVSVPEPGVLGMFGAGLGMIGLIVFMRRRRRLGDRA